MKRQINIKFLLTAVFAAAAAICVILAAISAGRTSSHADVPADTDALAASAAQPENRNIYILRDLGGRVCVYEAARPAEPCFITDIYTSTLRAADAQAVKDGLAVDGTEKLLMILEDLGS
ncbi:MAG: hypothetical protein IJP23_04855 [Oscillospiraceae bacterium]|nr:hypothetical protein [Oscillospiraceae bacterium]